MRNRTIFISFAVVLLGLALMLTVSAGGTGNPESPGPPDSIYSYTLEDIYNRINDGTVVTPSAFREPQNGPGTGTMHTLNEIYDLIGIRVPVRKTWSTYDDPSVIWDDGELQRGRGWPDPRFTDNGDGTVTDHMTGLIWLKDAGCIGMTYWHEAFTQIGNLNAGTDLSCVDYVAGTHNDWRLPNVLELQTLVDYGHTTPALPSDHPFIDVNARRHWTSTTNPGMPELAWTVGFHVGGVHDFDKENNLNFVWPVRGGE